MIAHNQIVDARMCFAVNDATPADEIEIEVEVPEEMSVVRALCLVSARSWSPETSWTCIVELFHNCEGIARTGG